MEPQSPGLEAPEGTGACLRGTGQCRKLALDLRSAVASPELALPHRHGPWPLAPTPTTTTRPQHAPRRVARHLSSSQDTDPGLPSPTSLLGFLACARQVSPRFQPSDSLIYPLLPSVSRSLDARSCAWQLRKLEQALLALLATRSTRWQFVQYIDLSEVVFLSSFPLS